MQDDDILDDDFDIDDEFEDDFDIDDELGANELEGQDGSGNDLASQKKSLLQKLFIPIVIALVALFGLIFAMGQGLFTGSNPSQNGADNTAIEDVVAIADEAPKQALAEDVQTTNENAPLPDFNAPIQETVQQDDTLLTPLPGEDTTESFALADLDAELQDNVDIENVGIETLEQPLLAIEEPIVGDLVTEETMENSLDTMLSGEPVVGLAVEDIQVEPIEDTLAESNIDVAVEDTAFETTVIDNDNQAIEIAANITNLQNEAESLKAEKEALSSEIVWQRSTISELKAEIEALKAEKATISSRAQATTEQPQTQPKTIVAKPKKPVARIQWELRSAQPGQATLAQKGSNDLRKVEIGSILKGLGRIKSIKLENGLWVVRGTKGSVSQ